LQAGKMSAATPSWVSTLKKFNGRHRGSATCVPNTEQEVLKHMRKLYKEDTKASREPHTDASRAAAAAAQASYAVIPRFFVPKRKHESKFRATIHKEGKALYLQKKAEQLLDEKELNSLWELMADYGDLSGMSAKINYDHFCQIENAATERCKAYLTTATFLKLPRDEFGRISATALFTYISKTVNARRIRIALTCYDEIGDGFLREQDLENFVFEQIPQLPRLGTLESDFYPYYVFTAVRKFVFFLDPNKTGKIRIRDIINSPIMEEFNRLRANPRDVAPDPSSTKAQWFSADSALEIYSMYLNLDQDKNGMLNKEEFKRYNDNSLTQVVVDRLFQEYRLYQSEKTGDLEMDYKTFLDFVLAMRHKNTRQGIEYFWRILDMEGQGYLTTFHLNYFFRAVTEKMVSLGHEPCDVADVVNEIFDMVSPAHPHNITPQDLIRSKCASTVISILTDVTGFWKYDNRAHLPSDDIDQDMQ